MKPSTPLPWHTVKDKVAPYSGIYGKENEQVTHEHGATLDSNAAYIAHACNAFPELVAALRGLVAETPLHKLNVRKDFSLMNAHAYASKVLHKLGEGC